MIRSALTVGFFSLGLWFLATSAVARDIFVDNVNGDDRRQGSSPSVAGQAGGPCRSIGRALQLVRSGDRVVVAKTDQPYRESITLQAAAHSGTSQQPFELVGNGAILDGTEPVPATAWEHVHGDVFRFRPARSSFQMLYLGQRPAPRRSVDQDEGLPVLEPLEWCLYDRHVYFRAEPKKILSEYPLSCGSLTVGITLYEVRQVVIRDLIVQGFQLDGINAHDNAVDCKLLNVTCRGNGRSGISIGGASRIQAVDCLVGDNGVAQIRTEGECRAELVHCELLANTAPGLVKEGGEVVVVEQPAP
jgi:hypothetical protein